jgi:hypothetical protein
MTPSLTPRWLGALLGIAALLSFSAAPAAAQYGGVGGLTVDPVEVQINGAFGYFGLSCPVGSTVEISIIGFPAVIDTAIADSSGNFLGSSVAMPGGVVAGQDYTVQSDCDGNVSTFLITAVCTGGTLPVDGDCPGGLTTGGADLSSIGTTTTTTAPVTTTTVATSGGPGSGGRGGLAITGASNVQIGIQVAVTLMAMGALLLLATTKRREQATVRVR